MSGNDKGAGKSILIHLKLNAGRLLVTFQK